MIRNVVKMVLFVLLVGIISVQVSAQVFSPAPNIGQHIVGTWVDLENNTTVVFNADGTGSWERDAYRWVIIGNTIIFVYPRDDTGVWTITISNDGRFLILGSGTGMGRLLQRR